MPLIIWKVTCSSVTCDDVTRSNQGNDNQFEYTFAKICLILQANEGTYTMRPSLHCDANEKNNCAIIPSGFLSKRQSHVRLTIKFYHPRNQEVVLIIR